MNLKKIIKESIDKIIVENLQFQFQQLGARYQMLRNYRVRIKRTDLTRTGNKQLIAFIGHEFYNFIAAVENALKRCITSGNINEGYGGAFSVPNLRDFGIEVPGELSNAWYDAKNAYYGIKGKWNRNFGAGNYNNAGNNSNIRYNQNEKLIYLLTNIWPKIQQDFIALNNQININSVCPDAIGAKKEIEDIIQIVENIRNAQGNNP